MFKPNHSAGTFSADDFNEPDVWCTPVHIDGPPSLEPRPYEIALCIAPTPFTEVIS